MAKSPVEVYELIERQALLGNRVADLCKIHRVGNSNFRAWVKKKYGDDIPPQLQPKKTVTIPDEKIDKVFELMEQGYNAPKACKEVGISEYVFNHIRAKRNRKYAKQLEEKLNKQEEKKEE